MTEPLKAPFPWFGGKSRVAPEVWARFGHVQNYVEPFFGSGAVLLGRPQPFDGVETINDADGFVANFWRSIKLSPEETAKHADNPVNENDLHARHSWLMQQRRTLRALLEGDPDFHDPKMAGYWVWGQCSSLGNNWCKGGPWHVDDNGALVRFAGVTGGITRGLPKLRDEGNGVNRPGLHGLEDVTGGLSVWFTKLAQRLRRVRVTSGDWSRVCTPSVTFANGVSSRVVTGVFLDPPYSAERTDDVYNVDSATVAHDVRAWAIGMGQRDDMRIALCGYEGEHDMPKDWSVYAWKAHGGYAHQGKATGKGRANRHRERIWFSPACLQGASAQRSLFDEAL